MPHRDERQRLDSERWEAVKQLEEWLEIPLIVLGFAWLVLLIVELLYGLSPLLSLVNNGIWILFIADFIVQFALAPRKGTYLKRNWFVALSLAAPALRIFRIARVVRLTGAFRGARGLRLLRFVTSLNRGIRTLRLTMGRRGFGYVLLLTMLVTVTGAAGMYSFEKDAHAKGGLDTFGAALWWTAMVMTTMGSQYWPLTPEGRLLCLLLALYAFTVFGYVTAVLATFFIGLDKESKKSKASAASELAALRQELAALREELRALAGRKKE